MNGMMCKKCACFVWITNWNLNFNWMQRFLNDAFYVKSHSNFLQHILCLVISFKSLKNSSVKLELLVSLLMMCNFRWNKNKNLFRNHFIVSKSKFYFGTSFNGGTPTLKMSFANLFEAVSGILASYSTSKVKSHFSQKKSLSLNFTLCNGRSSDEGKSQKKLGEK